MQWFIDAAKPFAGMDIKVVSETITTHEYESKVLAPAFTAITGIKITHDLIGEGDVVEKLQTQMQSGENIYDAYVNDSDLIGTHWRYQQARSLTDWMANEGKDVTNPEPRPRRLHRHEVHDRAGRQALPASRPAVREPLLVPLRLVQRREEQGRLQGEVRLRPRRAGQLVGLRGHRRVLHRPRDRRQEGLSATWTTARRTRRSAGASPMPGCRWPATATRACRTACRSTNGASRSTRSRSPVGSCVARGGDTNGPASVYAIQKYLDWMKAYAPPEAQGMTFGESGPVPSQG